MSSSAFEGRAIVRRPRMSLFVGILLCGGLYVASSWFADVPFGALPAQLLFFSLAALWNRWPRLTPGRVRGDEQGLWLDGEILADRSGIRSGYVHAINGKPVLRLKRRRNFRIDVVFDKEEDARTLLATLKLDGAHATASFDANYGGMRHAWMIAFWALFGVMAVIGLLCFVVLPLRLHLTPGLHVVMAVTGALPGVVGLLRRLVSVSVGADGVLLRRWLGARRFVPYSAIERAFLEDRDVVLHLRGGETVRLGIGGGKRLQKKVYGEELAFERGALVRRIEDGRAAYMEGSAHHANPSALLSRSGRSPREWIRALRTASEEAAGFRASALPAEELFRIVEDPAAPATARAGAAVVLRGALDTNGRARLRVAAETCAAPSLRVALEAASRPTEDAGLEGALASLEDEPERHPPAAGVPAPQI